MTTNYNVNDEVLIKARVNTIIIDRKGNIMYRLDIDHSIGFANFDQDEIVGKVSEFEEESDVQQ